MSWFPAFSPADETTYARQGAHVALRGLAGLRQLAALHLADRSRHETPSPLRWGWLALVGLAMRLGPADARTVAVLSTLGHLGCAVLAGVVWGPAAGALVFASPLGLTLGRRALGDTWAALAALALLAAVTSGAPPWTLALLTLAALAVKESNGVAVLATTIVAGPAWLGCFAGCGAWWVATVTLLGLRPMLRLLEIAGAQGNTEYSRAEQSGLPHRPLVDLVLVSPAIVAGWIAVAPWATKDVPPLWTWPVGAMILAAFLKPKNARLLLAVDLALRIALAGVVRVEIVGAMVVLDALIAWRIRHVYDPTTRALVGAVCR